MGGGKPGTDMVVMGVKDSDLCGEGRWWRLDGWRWSWCCCIGWGGPGGEWECGESTGEISLDEWPGIWSDGGELD